jgi:hypothetical protein
VTPPAPALSPIAERDAVDADTFACEVLPGNRPVVLRGQVAAWPAVAAGLAGPRAIADYLARFAGSHPTDVMIGPPEIRGRFFYSDDCRGFNFSRQQVALPALLARLVALIDSPDGYALYAGAAAAEAYLPGWDAENALGLDLGPAAPRLWIGNATHVSTHYDTSNNLACVVAGRRRFTLFPPDQIANLYVGPLDMTMAGQPASMVDLNAPDLARYPRFVEALAHAQAADLAPGDAIFIPALWWHDVQAAGPLDVLVNYWSDAARPQPFPALVHAIMALRDVSAAERERWRLWFDHYVFADDAAARSAGHLPDHAKGVLGPPSPARDARISEFLRRSLGGR